MNVNDVAFKAVMDIIREKRENLIDRALQIRNFEKLMDSNQEIYFMVTIKKPLYAQSESLKNIRVIVKGDLIVAVKEANKLYNEKYKKEEYPLSSITIGVFLPLASNLPHGIGEDWYSLVMEGKIPGAAEPGNFLNELAMTKEEQDRLYHESRYFELPSTVWGHLYAVWGHLFEK